MTNVVKKKALGSLLGIVVAVVLYSSSDVRLPVLDTTADNYFREAITKAGVAYATCRVTNASVSVVKESSIGLEPAGVGVSLAIGQALDPIDDMTERLSDVLVTAITALGVQKLAYEISISFAPPLLAAFLVVLSILLWFRQDRVKALQKTIMGFALFIAVARFCLPVSSMANQLVDKHFFAERISQAQEELALGSAELDGLGDFSLPEIDGVLGTIKNSSAFLKRKSTQLRSAVGGTVSNMGDIIESLLRLTFLYVGIFLIQVIALPLLSFYFLSKTVNAIFSTNVPVILHHPVPSGDTKPEPPVEEPPPNLAPENDTHLETANDQIDVNTHGN
jgi:hypothetical protein